MATETSEEPFVYFMLCLTNGCLRAQIQEHANNPTTQKRTYKDVSLKTTTTNDLIEMDDAEHLKTLYEDLVEITDPTNTLPEHLLKQMEDHKKVASVSSMANGKFKSKRGNVNHRVFAADKTIILESTWIYGKQGTFRLRSYYERSSNGIYALSRTCGMPSPIAGGL